MIHFFEVEVNILKIDIDKFYKKYNYSISLIKIALNKKEESGDSSFQNQTWRFNKKFTIILINYWL